MKYTQKKLCFSWQLKNIPEFKAGKMSRLFADCGTGFEQFEKDTANHSFMHTFFKVSADDIKNYAATLEKSGLEKVFENNIDGNLFWQFSCDEGLLYVTYMKVDCVARIILDRCENVKTVDFGYNEYEAVRNDTLVSQYSLHYDAMIRGTTCDCGMNYVLRLRDNSLIIIDGGEMEQSTDVAAADFEKYLREITGTSENEKMRVSLWLCTHAHNDHCDFLSKMIRFYGDEFVIERAALNFPHPRNVKNSPTVELAKSRIKEKYPDVRFMKLHAGMKFDIANAHFDILLSAEDTVGNDNRELFHGTNATSTVFNITADGVKTLFLADCCTENADVLRKNYSITTLKCNIVQIAHHGINEIYDTYEKINAQKAMLPQCLMNMQKRFMPVYDHLCKKYGKDNICFAQDATYMFLCSEGKFTESQREHAGTAYDGSEW